MFWTREEIRVCCDLSHFPPTCDWVCVPKLYKLWNFTLNLCHHMDHKTSSIKMSSVGKWAQSSSQTVSLCFTWMVYVHFPHWSQRRMTFQLNVFLFLSSWRCAFNNRFQVAQMLHVWLYLANSSASDGFHMQKCALFWVTKPREAYMFPKDSGVKLGSKATAFVLVFFPLWSKNFNKKEIKSKLQLVV